jgi:hypothetical protein
MAGFANEPGKELIVQRALEVPLVEALRWRRVGDRSASGLA